MGTARWEREQELELEVQQRLQEFERKKLDLEEFVASSERQPREAERKRAEFEDLGQLEAMKLANLQDHGERLAARRNVDGDTQMGLQGLRKDRGAAQKKSNSPPQARDSSNMTGADVRRDRVGN